jgi:hypothetical protein
MIADLRFSRRNKETENESDYDEDDWLMLRGTSLRRVDLVGDHLEMLE